MFNNVITWKTTDIFTISKKQMKKNSQNINKKNFWLHFPKQNYYQVQHYTHYTFETITMYNNN